MELRLPLEMSPGREAACRAVFGTWGFFRTMHGKTELPGTVRLTPPIFSLLFFQGQLQAEPPAAAPQWLGSPVRGCIFGIQLAKALCYSIISRRFPQKSRQTFVGCPDSLALSWKKQLHTIKANKTDSILKNGQMLPRWQKWREQRF